MSSVEDQATPITGAHPKVFCSHRSIDKSRVREIARKLRAAGIDAWFDEWEIKPGDDVVAAINNGLAAYDVGLVFFAMLNQQNFANIYD